jgi:hypothetical protein
MIQVPISDLANLPYDIPNRLRNASGKKNPYQDTYSGYQQN